MKKIIFVAVLAVLIGGGAGFWFGSRSAMSSGTGSNSLPSNASNGSGFGRGYGNRSNGSGQSGNNISGDILKKDDQSITIQLPQGGSKIIFFSDGTRIAKTISGSANDLTTGTMVMVNGSANSDGSISANNIQIRNVTSSFPFAPSGVGGNRGAAN